MRSSVTTRSGRGMVALVAAGLVAAGCGSPQATNDDGAGNDGDTTPVQVGLVYSQSGPLQAYGEQYIAGFEAGLDYATLFFAPGGITGLAARLTGRRGSSDARRTLAVAVGGPQDQHLADEAPQQKETAQ